MGAIQFCSGNPTHISQRGCLASRKPQQIRLCRIERIAMTSNGALLEQRWREWRDAGLGALNVSVDALDPARFAAITGADRLHGILRGIDAVLAEGFARIKLNAVLLRGLNDDQLSAFLDYVRARPLAVGNTPPA